MSEEQAFDLLKKQNVELDVQVKDAVKKRIEESNNLVLPSSSSYILAEVINSINKAIEELGYDPSKTKVDRPTLKNSSTSGIDLAFNVASLAKDKSENPLEVAEKLVDKLNELDHIKSAESKGAFVNLKLNYSSFLELVFKQISDQTSNYGHFRDNSPTLIIVEYPSTNVAKNMTVAHLRSTIIGQSLANIHAAAGNTTFSINHLGDWGTQFGNIIYQYNKELKERGDDFLKELEADPNSCLMRIYRDFNESKESNPQAVKEAQDIFLELEHGKPEYVELWDKFKSWSMSDFDKTFNRLGIKLDATQGESFYEDKMESVIKEGLDKSVLKKDNDGAVVFPSQPLTDPVTGAINSKLMIGENDEPRNEIIVKSNGGSVYITRDLATIKYREQELKVDKILYVVGKEQKSHFLELFNMADQLNYMPLGKAIHISFGHLNIDGKKMKSRAGKVVLLNDLIDEAIEAASNMLVERKEEDNKELDELEKQIAEHVGISALIFNDLKQNREKDIEFQPDFAKTLEAGSAAYIQYTNARINSVLRKVTETVLPVDLKSIELSKIEKELILLLSQFPLIIKDAAEHNMPNKIGNYLTEICQAFNVFYQEMPILKAETKELLSFRLSLSANTSQVIKNASNLLQLQLPDNM
jgi:arginyl-tRNA synthetase